MISELSSYQLCGYEFLYINNSKTSLKQMKEESSQEMFRQYMNPQLQAVFLFSNKEKRRGKPACQERGCVAETVYLNVSPFAHSCNI